MPADASNQQAEPKAKIFISYSRKDLAFVDRLEAALKVRGFEPLIDRAEIYAFEDWWKRIEGLIGKADTIIFTLSPEAIASEICAKEVAYAVSLNKRFAPIVCRRADDSAIPEPLRRLNFIFFDDAAQFEASADRLTEALQTDIGWVRQHTEFGEAARHWSAAGRPGGLLLRSPALEAAERWIGSRPHNAPVPTEETLAFVAESRRGASRRRNILTGSLAAGLVLALALAGLAYWQRGIAVQERQIADQQRQIAEQQRKRAEDTLAAATKTANSLVFDLAQRFKDTVGIPSNLIKDILDRARGLQEQLTKSGGLTPDLKYSKAAALTESSRVRKIAGDTAAALADAQQSKQIMSGLVASDSGNKGWRRDLAISLQNLGDVQSGRGDNQGALSSFRDSLAIIQELAAANPDDRGLQSSVAVAYDKVADIQYALGNHQDALRTFNDEIAVSKRLANADPKNAEWQHLLAVGHEHIGIIQQAQHDVRAAADSFQTERDILAAVTAAHPSNAQWLHRFATANKLLGEIQFAQGNLNERVHILSRRSRQHGSAGKDRSRQCFLAARSSLVFRGHRQNAGAAGQTARRAAILSRIARHPRPHRKSRSEVYRLAARPRFCE